MAELISKWKVVDMLTDLENTFQQFKPFEGFEHAMYRKLCEVEMEIGKMSAVEVVHGRWVNNKDDYPECDKCGYMPQYDHMIDDIWYSPYCPNCGAKMDGDGNG